MGEPVRFGQNFGLGAAGGFQDKMVSDKQHHFNKTNVS